MKPATPNPERLARAQFCLAEMVRNQTREAQELGVVEHDIPGTTLKRGEVILYSRDAEKTFTVEEPYCEDAIRQQRHRGSPIFTSKVMSISPSYIRPFQKDTE